MSPPSELEAGDRGKDSGRTRPVAYLGASEDELRAVRKPKRVLAMADQRQLFPHHGTLTVTSDALNLEGWMTLTPAEVTSVELTFTPLYSRWLAAGVRGRNASFGLFGSLGKPLILSVHAERAAYLLIDFHWFTGVNKARAWAPQIARWAEDGAPRS